MCTEYIIGLCLCCFGIGVCVGMMFPFLYCALYNKMNDAFGIELTEDDVEELKKEM